MNPLDLPALSADAKDQTCIDIVSALRCRPIPGFPGQASWSGFTRKRGQGGCRRVKAFARAAHITSSPRSPVGRYASPQDLEHLHFSVLLGAGLRSLTGSGTGNACGVSWALTFCNVVWLLSFPRPLFVSCDVAAGPNRPAGYDLAGHDRAAEDTARIHGAPRTHLAFSSDYNGFLGPICNAGLDYSSLAMRTTSQFWFGLQRFSLSTNKTSTISGRERTGSHGEPHEHHVTVLILTHPSCVPASTASPATHQGVVRRRRSSKRLEKRRRPMSL